MTRHLELYQFAASMVVDFKETFFKLLLCAEDPYERLVLDVNASRCNGRSKAKCYEELTVLNDKTYWRPDYFRCPFIGAVSPCMASPRNGGAPELAQA
ncbi:hypothetical protein F441_04714 [Phytophthora nicotianae CJ01A1]|uniref:Uncharacterized protein n=5 Tax=Phytophthora nicotianae TaxID=4792 RepID=W2QKG0_PHYN3|nr:hypothetical protein PPTG_22445 [Phytophthora nicotianae INRA-310]ETI52053.1 hypothetical protein F443_04724 [Phytophthora nicotianae P1569]ETK91916.1 hypothetical protein L915_04610 [Phytophthora nicotianae]ETO80819.1 hypothetical protein F444_04763 [Phytophthora nicotianae P1976]ETP21856.1 hypothetical protein F441_04714 [Phytophthora nicotianae CJ01A1]ETL98490.1 hypothetical protein L917_04445 [Phytophthora nicotianae]